MTTRNDHHPTHSHTDLSLRKSAPFLALASLSLIGNKLFCAHYKKEKMIEGSQIIKDKTSSSKTPGKPGSLLGCVLSASTSTFPTRALTHSTSLGEPPGRQLLLLTWMTWAAAGTCSKICPEPIGPELGI